MPFGQKIILVVVVTDKKLDGDIVSEIINGMEDFRSALIGNTISSKNCLILRLNPGSEEILNSPTFNNLVIAWQLGWYVTNEIPFCSHESDKNWLNVKIGSNYRLSDEFIEKINQIISDVRHGNNCNLFITFYELTLCNK